MRKRRVQKMTNRTDYSIARKPAPKKKKLHAVNIIRAVIQLISFILLPGLFISIFASIGAIYTAIIHGTFSITEYSWRIILVAAVFIVTFIWGRFFCGFVCSFGAMQDLLGLGGKRLPKKITVPEKADRYLRYLKFAVLLFMVFGVWTFSVTGTTLWSPWTIFGMYATFSGFPGGAYLLSVGGVLLLVIIIGSVFIERFFCKYLCPLGALFAVASKFRIFRIKKPSAGCGSCTLCASKCRMSVPMNKYDSIASGECINCLSCTTVCHRDNVKADTVPAFSGTAAAVALMGVYYVGCIPASTQETATEQNSSSEVSVSQSSGTFRDGTYTGTGEGFRGGISVTVTVSGGSITDITVNSKNDDNDFFSRAQSKIIPAIISSQSVNVDTVSGATFSSRGLIEAVKNALGDQLLIDESSEASQPPAGDNGISENTDRRGKKNRQTSSQQSSRESSLEESQESSGESSFEGSQESSGESSAPAETGALADGVYSGTGTGYRGSTSVTVTVSGGRITDITVNSYQDDDRFFSSASRGVISSIISSQSTDVDTVSGATFSSNGIIEAVSNALGIDFQNPNGTMSRRHGR